MGQPMDNIHTPTVPSGSTAPHRHADELSRLSLVELIKKKESVEEELKALGSVLESHGVTMNTALTTFDGFPRDDIDVAQIRTTRARIVRLKHDYKELMASIEIGLHDLHSRSQNLDDSKNSSSSPSVDERSSSQLRNLSSATNERPFARISSVDSGSPAEEAGLLVGDQIQLFGSVHARNRAELQRVAEVVQRHEGQPLLVRVVRTDQLDGSSRNVELQLTPRPGWGGQGSLGCHIFPL